MRSAHRILAASGVVLLVAGACSDDDDDFAPAVAPVEWEVIDESGDSSIEEGFVEVPLDYEDPAGASIRLHLVRHLATDAENRIGSLLVNPGGPGAGGTDLAYFAEQIYGDDLLARFDVVGFDPRGTGLSEPALDCVDDLDPYFALDTDPDSPDEEQAFEDALAEMTAGCEERSGDLLAHVTTVEAAKDMDLIRQALGEDEISYFGWSYGTTLGATWATLFPDTVRAAVLDGAVDPTVGRVDGLIDQAAGFEASLNTFLADCSGDSTCPFNNNGDAAGALDALLDEIETTEIPTSAGRPPLSSGIVELGIANALYLEDSWPTLAQALADAAEGDGAGLLAQFDEYNIRFEDGTYTNDVEAYYAITCADDPSTGGVAAALEVRDEFAEASPRIGSTTAAEVLMCALWPDVPRVDFQITGKDAGPIVVVGNTGDPATPFEGSRRMAAALEEGVFVAVEANQHTAYGLNDCIDGLIDTYLVDLVVPDAGTTC